MFHFDWLSTCYIYYGDIAAAATPSIAVLTLLASSTLCSTDETISAQISPNLRPTSAQRWQKSHRLGEIPYVIHSLLPDSRIPTPCPTYHAMHAPRRPSAARASVPAPRSARGAKSPRPSRRRSPVRSSLSLRLPTRRRRATPAPRTRRETRSLDAVARRGR